MNTVLPLPVLDTLQFTLSQGSTDFRCKAPVLNGSFQVGFNGKPDAMGEIDISANPDGSLTFDLHDHPITGPIRDPNRGRVIRHTTGTWGIINLVKTENGQWAIDVPEDEGYVPPSAPDRLVLSRTLAKVGERALSKL